MTVQQLIEKYQNKVEYINKSINKIDRLLEKADYYDSIDIEDLWQEKNNAKHDKLLFTNFIKDLKQLQQLQ